MPSGNYTAAIPGWNPGSPLQHANLLIDFRFARREEPSGWRLLLQIRDISPTGRNYWVLTQQGAEGDDHPPPLAFDHIYNVSTSSKTKMETTTDKHAHSNSVGAAHTMKAFLPASVLDSLISPTYKELKEAHYRIAPETQDARERAGREFRMRQLGIYAYQPYGPSTLRALAYENALFSSFARHVCAAQEARIGRVPVLRLEDLQAAELRAKALLRHRPILRRVEKLGAVQFALDGILGVHDFHGIRAIPDRKRVLLKVFTLLMCLSDAIRNRQQRPASSERQSRKESHRQ